MCCSLKPIPTLQQGRLYKGDSLHIFRPGWFPSLEILIVKFLKGRPCQVLPTTTKKNPYCRYISCELGPQQPHVTDQDTSPNSLVPIPHPQKEERVWYTLSAFLGTQDAACHMTVMTMHRFGIATHQPPSHAAIAGYSAVSHDNHM